MYLSRPCRRWVGLAALSSAIALSSLAIAPETARACSPLPGSRPTPLSQRLERAPYAFQGTVTAIDGETVTVQVDRYFSGTGPETVRVSGFNTHSCSDYVTETGDRYLFFAEGSGTDGTWTAVYDGAFGSTRRWTPELAAELADNTAPPANSGTLPDDLARDLRRRVADWSQQPLEAIDLVAVEPQQWSDGCLGLYLPGTACLQAITPGWRVVLSSGEQQWIYRTDAEGDTVHLENGIEVLPATTREAVFNQIESEFGVPSDQLSVAQVYPNLWGGCYGINTGPNQICTTIGIYGWQIVVESASGDRGWTYHTNLDGSEARLNPGLSSAQAPAAPEPERDRSTSRSLWEWLTGLWPAE